MTKSAALPRIYACVPVNRASPIAKAGNFELKQLIILWSGLNETFVHPHFGIRADMPHGMG
jgi:hypothetical protein